MIFGLFEFWLLALKQQIRPDRAAGILGAVSLFIVFLYTKPRALPDLFMILIILMLLTAGSLTAAM